MANFRKLADRAKKARGVIEQQGGTDALKQKAGKIGEIAKGKGSVGEKAKAAAEVAKEKPQPGVETRGEQGEGPVGGGGAPPEPQPTPSATGPETKAETGAKTGKVSPEGNSTANT
jgi:hypothetical protein